MLNTALGVHTADDFLLYLVLAVLLVTFLLYTVLDVLQVIIPYVHNTCSKALAALQAVMVFQTYDMQEIISTDNHNFLPF